MSIKYLIDRNFHYLLLAIILFLALFEWDYWFFQALRWVVTFVSFYIAYQKYLSESKDISIVYIVIGLLFNPIYPFSFERETWQLIDFICAVIFFSAYLNANEKRQVVETRDNDSAESYIRKRRNGDSHGLMPNIVA